MENSRSLAHNLGRRWTIWLLLGTIWLLPNLLAQQTSSTDMTMIGGIKAQAVTVVGQVYDVGFPAKNCVGSETCWGKLTIEEGGNTEWTLWTQLTLPLKKDQYVRARVARIPDGERFMSKAEIAAHLPRLIDYKVVTPETDQDAKYAAIRLQADHEAFAQMQAESKKSGTQAITQRTHPRSTNLLTLPNVVGQYNPATDGRSHLVITALQGYHSTISGHGPLGRFEVGTTEYKVRYDSGVYCREDFQSSPCQSEASNGGTLILVCVQSTEKGKADPNCQDLVPGQRYLLGGYYTSVVEDSSGNSHEKEAVFLRTGSRRSLYQIYKACVTQGPYAGKCVFRGNLDDFPYWQKSGIPNEATPQ